MDISLSQLPHINEIFRNLTLSEVSLSLDLILETITLILLGFLITIFGCRRMPCSLLCGLGNSRKEIESESHRKMTTNNSKIRHKTSSRLKQQCTEEKLKHIPSPPDKTCKSQPRPLSRRRKGSSIQPNKQTEQTETVTSEVSNDDTPQQFLLQGQQTSLIADHLPHCSNTDMHTRHLTVVPQEDSSTLTNTFSQQDSRSQPPSITPVEASQIVQRESEISIPYNSASSVQLRFPNMSDIELKIRKNSEIKDVLSTTKFSHSSVLLDENSVNSQGSSNPVEKEQYNLKTHTDLDIPCIQGTTTQHNTIHLENSVGKKHSLQTRNTTYPVDNNSVQNTTLPHVIGNGSRERSKHTCIKNEENMKTPPLDTIVPNLNNTTGSQETNHQEQQREYQRKGNEDVVVAKQHEDHDRNISSSKDQQTVTSEESKVSSPIPSDVDPKHNDDEMLKSDCAIKQEKDQFGTPLERLTDGSTKSVQNNIEVCSITKKDTDQQQKARFPNKQSDEDLRKWEKSMRDEGSRSSSLEGFKRAKREEAQESKLLYLQTKYQRKQEQGLDIYKPLLDHRNDTRRIQIGDKNTSSSEKVILLVGGGGAGKTTWINGLINYIYGTEWDDNYRIRLIEEKTPGKRQNQAKSQTKKITSYTIYLEPWFRVPFSVTVIDTPGFGDTGGINKDKEIKDQIGSFFTTGRHGGIGHIDAIGFVIQSSLVR